MTAALAAVVLFFVTACATAPSGQVKRTPRTAGTEFGQWSGRGTATRVVSKDGSAKTENWSVSLEVVSRTPGFGRIEVTGAMGVYGGTIAWNENETRILLPGQRKFVVAPNSSRAFVSILPFPISPAEVEAILFDREFDVAAFQARGISCRNDSTGERQTCRSEDGFSLERIRGREDTDFQVTTADGAKVKMLLKPVRSKLEERPELWALEAPRGFKVIQQSRL